MPFINMKTTATLDIAKKDALSKELCSSPETVSAKVKTG